MRFWSLLKRNDFRTAKLFMNCDATQGCFFKKSVCNSGCKSKLPVEIAKVSTARLTFSSPLVRLSEAFPPFLSFFLFLLRLQLFFLIKPLGVIFRSKKIVPRSSNLSMIYHISWNHLFSFHRTVRGYNPYDEIFQPTSMADYCTALQSQLVEIFEGG